MTNPGDKSGRAPNASSSVRTGWPENDSTGILTFIDSACAADPVKMRFGDSNLEGWLAFGGFVVVGVGLTPGLQVVDLSRRYAERASVQTKLISLIPAVLVAFFVGFTVWSIAFGFEAILDTFVFGQPRFYRGYNSSGHIVAFRGLFPASIGGGARAGFVLSRLLTAPMKRVRFTGLDLVHSFLGACLGAFIAAII